MSSRRPVDVALVWDRDCVLAVETAEDGRATWELERDGWPPQAATVAIAAILRGVSGRFPAGGLLVVVATPGERVEPPAKRAWPSATQLARALAVMALAHAAVVGAAQLAPPGPTGMPRWYDDANLELARRLLEAPVPTLRRFRVDIADDPLDTPPRWLRIAGIEDASSAAESALGWGPAVVLDALIGADCENVTGCFGGFGRGGSDTTPNPTTWLWEPDTPSRGAMEFARWRRERERERGRGRVWRARLGAHNVLNDELRVRGALPHETIERRVWEQLRSVWWCYRRARGEPDGLLYVTFVVAADGTVGDATNGITHFSLRDAGVDRCVLRAVRRWTFPEASGPTLAHQILRFWRDRDWNSWGWDES